jgi:DNA-binding NarL/FixJ family response regulator
MPLRVFIVDDSSLIRDLLRRCLEAEPGWKVCGEAVNGKDAVENAQKVQPNFIVLDLSMPVMNGLEAARILHKLMPAVPMIMFTSFITTRLRQEALDAGIRAVIAKDEPLSSLVSTVRSFGLQDAA